MLILLFDRYFIDDMPLLLINNTFIIERNSGKYIAILQINDNSHLNRVVLL